MLVKHNSMNKSAQGFCSIRVFFQGGRRGKENLNTKVVRPADGCHMGVTCTPLIGEFPVTASPAPLTPWLTLSNPHAPREQELLTVHEKMPESLSFQFYRTLFIAAFQPRLPQSKQDSRRGARNFSRGFFSKWLMSFWNYKALLVDSTAVKLRSWRCSPRAVFLHKTRADGAANCAILTPSHGEGKFSHVQPLSR